MNRLHLFFLFHDQIQRFTAVSLSYTPNHKLKRSIFIFNCVCVYSRTYNHKYPHTRAHTHAHTHKHTEVHAHVWMQDPLLLELQLFLRYVEKRYVILPTGTPVLPPNCVYFKEINLLCIFMCVCLILTYFSLLIVWNMKRVCFVLLWHPDYFFNFFNNLFTFYLNCRLFPPSSPPPLDHWIGESSSPIWT